MIINYSAEGLDARLPSLQEIEGIKNYLQLNKNHLEPFFREMESTNFYFHFSAATLLPSSAKAFEIKNSKGNED